MDREEGIKHIDNLLNELAAIRLEAVIELVKNNPNDTDLGREIRKLVTSFICTK